MQLVERASWLIVYHFNLEWKNLLKQFLQKQLKRNLFHPRHAWEAIMVTFRKRKGPNRLFALLTITIFFFQVMPYFGEGAISYLYVQKRYNWHITEYSRYSTITSIASLVGEFYSVYWFLCIFMSKIFGMRKFVRSVSFLFFQVNQFWYRCWIYWK